MNPRRIVAAVLTPLLVISLMGSKGCASSKSSGGKSNASPKATALTPSPLPTPGAGAAMNIKGVPAPQTDANPKPLFPPNKCASVAFPTDTGLRIIGKYIVGRVRSSCVAPLPASTLTELQIWKVDGFNTESIPGGYNASGAIPDISPNYTTYKVQVPCVPGTYAFEFYVTWLDPDGSTGGAVGGAGPGSGTEEATVNPGDC